jgi:ferric-dicitrate binding protein FerR (iron transport regulator)
MNYRNMIEPYLYGSLSPEDEVAFERQMSRDPALVEAAARRLNAQETLSKFKIPAYSNTQPRPASARWLMVAIFLAMCVIVFAWWKMRSRNSEHEAQVAPVEAFDVPTKALSD